MKIWWKWMLFQEASVDYERLQTPGFFYVVPSVLVKLYGDNPEELAAACKRHTQFYNSKSCCGLVIHDITPASEGERTNEAPISDETINSLKTGLVGPLAGLGDSVHADTIMPTVAAFYIGTGQTGNLIAPFPLEGILVVIVWPFAIRLLKKSYHTRREGIQEIFSSDKLNWITATTPTLDGITLGALAASYVMLSSPLEFVLGKGSKITLWADVLDVMLENILPSSMVLLSVYLLNKEVSVVEIILILAAACALGVLTGIF